MATFANLVMVGLVGCVAAPRAEVDPPRDIAHPAEMVVLHIPTGGVHVNGVAYVAAGEQRHGAVVLFHGQPGNEKNLDLAQAIRRAGWTVVTMNYRGSWGSEGTFSFTHVLEDVRATLAYVREPAIASRLRIDPARIVIAGHSMGGWAVALVGADSHAAGLVMISAGNIGNTEGVTRDEINAAMADNMESLSGTTPDALTDEILTNASAFSFVPAGLANTRLLVLSADDGNTADTDKLVAGVIAAGGTQVTTVHVATDHSWSDARLRLAHEVTTWLARVWGRDR
jgi:acetyl esterase/lipase